MRTPIAAILLCAIFIGIAQARTGSLLWPLPSSKVLTGGFADTRADHFHGGVDLRARTPEPVIAPTDGWIERISVQPSGYGRVLYFRMDDGRTAVFGHLSSFVPAIEQALRDSELVVGTYRVDVSYPEPQTSLTFARGATLAYSGKTGVGPPHLHFEIREGSVQTDPLANYEPVDHDKPVIVGLWWTSLSQYSPLTSGNRLIEAQNGANEWLTTSSDPIRADDPVAFYVQTYDPGPWGRNSVPCVVRIKQDAILLFETHPARIDLLAKDFYSKIVWPEQKRNKRDIRRLFAPPPPRQFRMRPESNDGWIVALKGDTITIEVEDRAGNIAQAFVPVTCGNFDTTQTLTPPTQLRAGSFKLQSEDATLSWASMGSVAPLEVEIAPADLGFASACTLSYRWNDGEKPSRLYFYERTGSGGRRPLWRLSGLDSTNGMACTIFHGGTYGIGIDTDPPTLQVSAYQGRLKFRVSDAGSYIDDSTIRCIVDGATAIPEFEYDVNGGFVWTQTPLRRGTHHVEFSAADRVGNIGRWLTDVRIP